MTVFAFLFFKITSKLSFHSPYYAKACNEFVLRVIAPLQHSSFRRNVAAVAIAVGNTVSDLTGSRFESETIRFRDERVTARPANQ